VRRPHKFNAKPTVVDGIRFASMKEARRYQELKLLEKAGQIRDLSLQPAFDLMVVTKQLLTHKVGEYVADFSYNERVVLGSTEFSGHYLIDGLKRPTMCAATVPGINIDWRHVVEDVKGFKTPLYRWKKKHVETQYGIEIREI
jgi:hypothetical protein